MQGQQSGQDAPKDIVVFLDNSSSMNGEEDWDQCVNANYAMQLFGATLGEHDRLHLIEAVGNSYRKFNNRQEALRYIKNIRCSQADEDVALEQAIQIYEEITNYRKFLILIGDGQWFGTTGLALPEDNQKNKLNTFFSQIVSNRIIYINTNKKGNPNNKFFNEIYSNKGLEILQTDSNAAQLQESIKDVIKKMLNIGKNGLSRKAYKIQSNTLVIGTDHLPLKKIFIIDQSGNTTTPQVTGDAAIDNFIIISSKKENSNNPLSAKFIIIKPKNHAIRQKVTVTGIGNNKVEIYAVADFNPEFEGLNFDGTTDTICKGRTFPLKLKISKQEFDMLDTIKVSIGDKQYSFKYDDKKNEASAEITIGNNATYQLKIEIKDKSGTFKKTFSKNIKTKDCSKEAIETDKRKGHFDKECVVGKTNLVKIIYTLPKMEQQEDILVNAHKINNYNYTYTADLSRYKKDSIFSFVNVKYGKYRYKDSVKLWRNMCALKLKGQYNDTVSFSMLNKHDTINWALKNNVLFDNKQVDVAKFQIKDKKGKYWVDIDSKGNLILHRDNRFKGIIANCFRSTSPENYKFEITHPDAYRQSIKYNVVIQKTDTGFWERCYREIIGLISFILFLIYLYFIWKKPRFKRNAKIIKYTDSDLEGRGTSYKLSSWTDFIDRYIIPFGVQTKVIEGIKYMAIRNNSRSIKISGKRITNKMGTYISNIHIPFQPIDPTSNKPEYSDNTITPGDVIYKKTGTHTIRYYKYIIGKNRNF